MKPYITRKESGQRMTLPQSQMSLLDSLGETTDQYTLSPAAFRARLFQLLDSEKVSRTLEELSSLKLHASHQYSDLNIYSLKTLTGCAATTKGEHSPQSSISWGNLIMMSKHKCLTLKTSESLKTENGYSSRALTEILEPNPDPKYFLSEEATKKLLSKLSEEVSEKGFMTLRGGLSCTLSGEGGGQGANTGLYMIADDGPGRTRRVRKDITPPIRAQGGGDTPGIWVFADVVHDPDKKYTLDTWATQSILRPRNQPPGGGMFKEEYAGSLDTNCNIGVTQGYQIRKITPRECWRLQGTSDEVFDKAASVNSDSQLYKQAGNGATETVVYEIARRLS